MNRRLQLALALAATTASIALASATDTNPAGSTSQIVPLHSIPTPQLPAAPSLDALLKWDKETKESLVTNGIVDVHFKFWLTNVSSSDVIINSVSTSCGCTAAKLPEQPWRLIPGTNGEIGVTMNVANKSGIVQKSVTINTDKGSKMLFVKANILPPTAEQMAANERENNQKIALADRQAVFRGDCARCHADSINKSGKELYTSVCGVCHEADHRATMVPNLHALTQPTNAEYWRNWITKGKQGTLMPAFAQAEGGILSDAQVESLVKYLMETISSKPAQPRLPAPTPPAAAKPPAPQPLKAL